MFLFDIGLFKHILSIFFWLFIYYSIVSSFTFQLTEASLMKNIAKKKFKTYFDLLFAGVRKNKFYSKIRKLSPALRILIFAFCVLRFIIATLLIPPLPFGNFILILWFVILFPIDKVKSKFYYIVNRSRIKWLYTKWLQWKQKVKRKRRNKSPTYSQL